MEKFPVLLERVTVPRMRNHTTSLSVQLIFKHLGLYKTLNL